MADRPTPDREPPSASYSPPRDHRPGWIGDGWGGSRSDARQGVTRSWSNARIPPEGAATGITPPTTDDAAARKPARGMVGTLGVAILGSLASAFYRHGLPDGSSPAIRESLGGALAAARESGSAELAAQAEAAFTDALQLTSLYGGVILVAAAAAVWKLTPSRLDLATVQH